MYSAQQHTQYVRVCVVAWSIEVTRKWQRASGGLLLVALQQLQQKFYLQIHLFIDSSNPSLLSSKS